MDTNIFDILPNEKLFLPLTKKHKKIYYDCILLLMRERDEQPVLYEDNARVLITEYLQKLNYEPEDDIEENVEENAEYENTPTTIKSATILKFFRNCGWLTKKELGRNAEYITYITKECGQLISFLRGFAEPINNDISRYIYSMYDTISMTDPRDMERDTLVKDRLQRPYTNVLKRLLEQKNESCQELLALKANMDGIMRNTKALENMSGIGWFLMNDKGVDKFFDEYFSIKNQGKDLVYIAKIQDGLFNLQTYGNGLIVEKMEEEYSAIYGCEKDVAHLKIQNIFRTLYYFVEVEYHDITAVIMERIDTYYKIMSSKMQLYRKYGYGNAEAVIDRFLNKIRECDNADDIYSKLGECICIQKPHQYVSAKSIERREIKRIQEVEQEIEEKEIKSEDWEQFYTQMNRKNVYLASESKKYFQHKIRRGTSLNTRQNAVESWEEGLQFISALINGNTDNYGYDVEVEEGKERQNTKFGEISYITIQEREKQEVGK